MDFDRSKFSRKRYRNTVKMLRKHLEWDGYTIDKKAKITLLIDRHIEGDLPLVITDRGVDFYYDPQTGELLYTAKMEESVEVVALD